MHRLVSLEILVLFMYTGTVTQTVSVPQLSETITENSVVSNRVAVGLYKVESSKNSAGDQA
jgi:hypothetical protein